MEFSQEELSIISPFFTNLDKPVFALKNLPEVVKGALFSRYSRSDKSLRRLLLDEFINDPEIGFKEIVLIQLDKGINETIATKKAEEFYDRVLVGYGDDSVAELGGAHIACEDVSQIAAKVLEDSRIGLSPLEKSTRYVRFNQKINGKYRYYSDPVIMNSEFAELYENTCDTLFDMYSKLIEPLEKALIERFPIDQNTTERAYKFTIRAKACDILRSFLPASALTNVGIFGNGRAFEYLITKLYSNDLSEMKCIANSMHDELSMIIPSFVKRANDSYGKQQQDFFLNTLRAIEDIAAKISINESGSDALTLVDYDKYAENRIVAGILYPVLDIPFDKLLNTAKMMSTDEKGKIINEYMHHRLNRRNRPGRASELGYYLFDILGNFGIYRDLQRHRILTQQRQLLTTKHGYDTPQELIDIGFYDDYKACMESANEAYNKISRRFPKQAQYVVPLGYRVRWYFWLNLREVYHLCELRTSQQGHPDYRKICQQIYLKIKEVHPALAENMRFVDMNSYGLERLEAEKRLDKKMAEVQNKYR